MKALMTIALAAGTLAAAPAFAQSSSPQQMLQGLLTGNQSQDQAVRDAYERGYRAGSQDEARMESNNRGTRPYNNGSRDYSGNNGSYGGNGNSADRGYNSNNNGNYPAGSYNNGRND